MLEKIIKPMEPLPCSQVGDNEEYLYQVKWDGVRMLAYINRGQVRLVNKHQHLRTRQYPELQMLPDLLEGYNAVLDGEIVAFKAGQPSFPAVLSRDQTTSSSTIEQLQETIPIDYMIFDLIFLNDKNIMPIPLVERQQLLEDVIQFKGRIHPAENFPQGSTLFAAVKEQQLEGIVAKKKKGVYIEGKSHRDWMKIKYRRMQNCVIGGYTLKGKLVNALLLGVYHQNMLLYAGKVGSGLKASEWETLTRELPRLITTSSPFSNFKEKADLGYQFVEPVLTVRVGFAEWTDNMHLRSPVITNFTRVNPAECQI